MNYILQQIRKLSIEKNIKIYVVGGYIRDIILKRQNEDIDLIVEKNIDYVINFLRDEHGLKIIEIGNKGKLYRIVDKSLDMIIDLTEMQGNSVEEDLLKRDFTINGLAVDIYKIENFSEDDIISPVKGLKDIENKVIRHMYDEVFVDDPLRMLRAVRFMAELDFDMDNSTKQLIKKYRNKLKSIPGERISQELFKILIEKNTYYYFNMMDRELGILEEIFPEITPMRNVGECKYHVVDVLTHSFYTLEVAEKIIYANGYFEDHVREAFERHSEEIIASNHKRLAFMKLGAFFHDIGKPSAMKVDEGGRVRFKGHEITGAEITKTIVERLKLSIKERDLLYRIVSKHMMPLVLYKNNDVSGKALYSFFSELKDDTLDVLLVSLSDIIATRKLLDPQEEMGKYKVHIEYLANNYLTRFKEIEDISDVITGKDIIESFQLDNGIMIKDIIEEVRKAIYNGKIGRNKKHILQYIKDIL